MMRVLVNAPSSPVLAYITFLCFCVIIFGLCEANMRMWDDNLLLQNVTSAVFCVYSAALYLTYTIITKLLHLVLTHAESNMQVWRRHYHYNNVSSDYEIDETIDVEAVITTDSEELNLVSTNHVRGGDNLSRSTIISSMYLGGSGAFLSIIPLCMWDFSVTSSFISSMLTISMMDAKRISAEFKPDVDKAQAIQRLKLMRNGYHLIAIVATILTGYLDMRNSSQHSMDMGKVFTIKWPFLFLAACSPILLRAGGGGVGNFIHSIPPSQTLEIGLPVSLLLAILVLCWYPSIEDIFRANTFQLNVVIPMVLICPLCIAGALTFILYGMKRRSCGVISVILLLMLATRQQIHKRHRFHSAPDIAAFVLALTAVVTMGIYLLYKYKVYCTFYKKKVAPAAVVTAETNSEDNTILEAEV